MIYWRKNRLHIKLWWSTCLISSNTVSPQNFNPLRWVPHPPYKEKYTEAWSINTPLEDWIVYFFFLLLPLVAILLISAGTTAHWSLWLNFSWLLHIVTKGSQRWALHPWIWDGTRRDTSSKIRIQGLPIWLSGRIGLPTHKDGFDP